MGMDAWIFSRPKADFEEHERLVRKLEELKMEMNRKIRVRCSELQEKYPDFKGANIKPEYVTEHFAEGDAKDFIDYCTKVFQTPERDELEKKIGETNDSENELQYWRKNYPLHNYITEHFLEDGKDDNCEPIVLTKDGVEEMVAVFKDELKKWNESGDEREVEFFTPTECDYVSREVLEQTIRFFENLVHEFSEDKVIYYYTWY